MPWIKSQKLIGRNAVYVTVRRKVTYILQQKRLQPLQESFRNSGRMACYHLVQRRLQLIRRLNILISSMSCSENQLNIIITVTSNIHHVTSQGRKNHHEERTRKLKWGNLEPFDIHLLAHIVVHLQVQQSQILFALYAVNMMPLRTFMLQGHFMRLNRSWIVNMLWSWQIVGEI